MRVGFGQQLLELSDLSLQTTDLRSPLVEGSSLNQPLQRNSFIGILDSTCLRETMIYYLINLLFFVSAFSWLTDFTSFRLVRGQDSTRNHQNSCAQKSIQIDLNLFFNHGTCDQNMERLEDENSY